MFRLDQIAEKIVALDIEGDGQRISSPIEIATCQVFPEFGKSWSSLMQAPGPISRFATRVHGLTLNDLEGAPLPEEVAQDLISNLEGAVVIGHGIRQDLIVVDRAFEGLPRYEAIDTLSMSRQLLKGLPHYDLQTVANVLDVEPQHKGRGRHSALYDASINAAVFLKLCDLPKADLYLKSCGFKLHRKPQAEAPAI